MANGATNPDVTSMFASLLAEMKKMNKNVLVMTELVEGCPRFVAEEREVNSEETASLELTDANRRQALRKELNKDYAAMCRSSTVDPSFEFLFGDISKLARDSTDANKLRKKMRPSHTHSPYGRNNRYSAGGRRPFGHKSNWVSPYQR